MQHRIVASRLTAAPSAEYKSSVDVGERQTDRLISSPLKGYFSPCGRGLKKPLECLVCISRNSQIS